MILPEGFAGRFSTAMREMRVTRGRLADKLKLTRGAVGHWASGRRTPPDPTTIETIAQELGVRPAWLAFGDGEMLEEGKTRPPPPVRKRRKSAQEMAPSKPDVHARVAAKKPAPKKRARRGPGTVKSRMKLTPADMKKPRPAKAAA